MYSLRLTFTQAFFEAVSGYTTTGLSVVDVERAPRIILLWRSIMQFAGGAGLAIIMLAAIAGPVGTGLHFAEGRSQQLAPHVKESAQLVVFIYCGYLIAGVLAYLVVGLSFFDALNHAMAAVSTGGFATHAQSIGYWDSAGVEAITICLMIMGNLNFLTAYYLLHGNFRAFIRNGEVKLMTILLPFGFLLLVTLVCPVLYPNLGKASRVALFEATSALTTTGFSTVSYRNWNATGFLLLILFMLIGGGTCSTAGGLKQYRVYIMVKSIFWEIRRNILSKNAVIENYIWYGDRKDYMTDDRIRQIMVFAFLYIASFFLGTLVLTIGGYELEDSMFEFASALGTVGLSIGITSPAAAPFVIWTLTVAMFLGRLEFFVILVGMRKLAEKLFAKMHAHP